MLNVLLVSNLTSALAAPAPHAHPTAPARVFIPDDADPCAFERFKADPYLSTWIREMSPNTATAARCYHTPAKILAVASQLLSQIDRRDAAVDGGQKVDLRAAALTGYQIDSLIQVERDGTRHVAVILKSGINGPTFAQVYRLK